MPVRPDQHKLEDLSRAKFQLILPTRWVFRDKVKDYGIDGEVELFDSNNHAQGLLFYVQLKATSSQKKSSIMVSDLGIKTLLYYQKLELPVLLVRYSEFEDWFYVKWVNNMDLTFVKPGSKTLRIKLEEEDRWTNETASRIEKKLIETKKLKTGHFNFPVPYTITIRDNNINGYSKTILQTQLKRELKKYSSIIEFNDRENSVINIIIDKNDLKVDISDLTTCTYHGISSKGKEHFSEEISKDILLGIAYGMFQLGQIDYCGKIIFENDLQSQLAQNKELFFILLPTLFQSSYFEKTVQMVNQLQNNYFSSELALISNTEILNIKKSVNHSRIKIIEDFFQNNLTDALEKKDNHRIGTAYYNLGNHYRGEELYYESIKNYIAAKRFEPKYLKQDYYYSELASVLFIIKKYKTSIALYSKAIELGANGITIALYGDSLMFSGQYQKALDTFNEYNSSLKSDIDEFYLKALCLENIIQKRGIKTQKRDSKSASLELDFSVMDRTVFLEKQLNRSLDFDLLCPLAWFNLGVIQSEESNFKDAMLSFLITAFIETGDIEAWINATISSINIQAGISTLIIETAYFYNGEDYLEQLYSQLEQNNGSENVSKFSEMVDTILPKRTETNSSLTIRMMNKDGKFENIFKPTEPKTGSNS